MLGSVGVESRAWGANAKEATSTQANLARKACLSGDYQKGVALLSDLFVETKDPVMIFNQGRCFEQNSRHEEAISRFEEYLRITKNSGAKDRAEAEEHIAECQTKLDKTRSLVPPAPVPVPDAPPSTPPAGPASVGVATQNPSQETAAAGHGLRVAGLVTGAVGVVALGSAALFTIKANNLADDLNRPTGYDRSKVSEHSTYKTLVYVGYGVGAACLLGGAILYGVGASQANPSSVALVPLLGPGHASLNLQGAF
jgi:hypothetical protein